MLLYLGILAVFYWVIGIALVLGIGTGLRGIDLTPLATGWLLLLAGVVLLAASFVILPPGARGRAATAGGSSGRWERALDRIPGTRGLVLLALGAGTAELATMVPYLAATGILAAADLPALSWSGALGGYVVVMTAPALVLVVARSLAAARLTPLLQRWDRWLRSHGRSTVAWVLGVLGVLVGLDGAGRLIEGYGIA